MAVVPPGFFGDYFTQYGRLSDSRNWNTKSYDYAVVKNKGEVSEEAKNENTTAPAADPVYGRGLFAVANKNAYVNANGALIEEKDDPIYQIRNNKGIADNAYYVDQNKGDVYFRPTRVGATSITMQTPVKETPAVPLTAEEMRITPQYFGTVFNLEEAPNPEDFGLGKNSRIVLNVTGTGQQYSEIIVNGVPISVGSTLDTHAFTTSGAGFPTVADSLYNFSNSFTVGADNFSPISGTWTYQPNGGAGYYESTAIGQSSFNSRTVDNFVMRINVNGGDTGIQLRANNSDDPVGASGYYVKLNAAGTSFQLFKAGIAGPLPLTGAATVVGGQLEIRMNGTEISINGATFDDNNKSLYGNPFFDGYVSLRSDTAAPRRFDNFELVSYPKPIQLLSRALKKGENSIVVRGYDTAPITVNVSGQIRDNRRGTPFDIDIGTSNIPPDLQAFNGGNPVSITSRFYRDDKITGANTTNNTYLDEDKAYWSVSTKSALGIAGKIMFVNKEGGGIQKTKDQFSNINNLMQNLTSILGSQDDLFNGTLAIIK